MASSSSESAHQVVSDNQDQTPKEMITPEVEEKEASETEEVIVDVQKPYWPSRRWSLLEDAKLLVHVADNGPGMWKSISEKLPKRSSQACRVRWARYLQPGQRDGPFRNQEEMDLMVAHARNNNITSGRKNDTLKRYFFSLKAIRLMRERRLNPSIYPPTTRLFPRSNIVSAMTSAGSGMGLSRISSRFNLHADVQEKRTSMANYGVCRRLWELHAHMNRDTNMASTRNVHQIPAVNPSVTVMNLNLTLATTAYPPQPPSPPVPPQASPSLPTPSPSSPPSSNLVDFLGVGSV